MTAPDQIRNFSIIAHIDHGKSTIADRLIQVCGGLTDREMTDQVLDNMDIERERGITIKAQTLANVYQAVEADHEIVPVLNKIDLPAAEPERVQAQIEEVIGLPADDAIQASAKTGAGISDILEAVVKKMPPPVGDVDAPLTALLVDSWYDAYLGVMTLVRVKHGQIRKGMKIRMMGTGATHVVERVGVFSPKPTPVDELGPGEIGFINAGVKTVSDARVGDTITEERRPCAAPLEGFKPSVPVVFCGLFPVDTNDFSGLREALEKLSLNDASFSFEAETSAALGFGFRCGFLGLLHMEVIRDRLEREFNLDLISTAPSVVYQMTLTDGTQFNLHNPADMPEVTRISEIEEPWIKATIMTPDEYLGAVLTLCTERRGEQLDLTYAGNRAMAVYRLPLNEVVFDFYDRLKSVTRGYASFDYAIDEYRLGELVKVSILVNGDPVDALSMIVHREQAEHRGRAICVRLKDLVPRQMFKVALQAAIGGKVIARETISALRKDVTAKCYGGDISRKKKLLEKQKEGKKKMRQFGKVDIPQNAFFEALKMGDS